MTRLSDIAQAVEPIHPDVIGAVVYDRFEAEPDLMAIAVVDEHGAPVGLVERNHFALKLGSTYGRALYAGRPISLIMDREPLIVDAGRLVADFSGETLASRPSDLLKGIIVVADGRYCGVATIIALMTAITARTQQDARELSALAGSLSSAKAEATSANLLLREALDAMSEGVAIFDQFDECVLWNRNYARSIADGDQVLRPGVSLEALLRHGLDRGQFLDAKGREATWLAERLRRRATLTDRIFEEQVLADGRCVRVEDTRLASGGSINVAVDVTAIKRREESFRFLFDNNPVPLCLFDLATQRFIAVNEAAAQQYGYTAAAFTRLTVMDVIAPEERKAAADRLSGRLPISYGGERSWVHLTAAGERLNVRPFMRPLTYHDRPAMLVAALDVTAQHQAEASLKAAAALAEAANGAKSEFLANMSHEIRTPLNGILGVASVLSQGQLSRAQSEMVGIIETSAKTLQALLADILDIAKIEAGRLDLQPDVVRPADLARQVAALFSASSAEKGLAFELIIDEDAHRPVLADSTRLAQIFTNLCSNAVKFTERGGVTLKVAAEPVIDGRRFTISVTDSGIGISMEARERLFERFSQADGSITRRFGGTGLGLAISQQLAHMMGGWIEVASEEGQGSTFSLVVELPDAVVEAADTASAATAGGDAAPSASEPAERLRVLLVEDHPVNRKVIDLMIGEVVNLEMAHDGAQGLAAEDEGGFDLILMDMQMPVMDGLTATRKIRERETRRGGPRTPIIILTANVLPEHVTACLAAGADTHLAKPVSAPALLAAMQHALAGAPEPALALSA